MRFKWISILFALILDLNISFYYYVIYVAPLGAPFAECGYDNFPQNVLVRFIINNYGTNNNDAKQLLYIRVDQTSIA